MNAVQPMFDSNSYKQTTRQQWESAAEAWHRWSPLLSKWLGPATELMLNQAGIGEGAHVLDVAAGAGEQTLAVAQRVGSRGRVLATDISPSILDYAASAAREAGFKNIHTQELDGEQLSELESESFDAVISRVGLIYFPDKQKALGGMMQALKPGGKVAAMVYSTADKNNFFSMPVSIIRRRANLPPPLPGQPGPFSLGGEGALEKEFIDAGFKDIKVEVVEAPLELTSANECLQFEKESFGALHQMLSGLSVPEQEEAWVEVGEALQQFEQNGNFRGPCEMVVAVGTK